MIIRDKKHMMHLKLEWCLDLLICEEVNSLTVERLLGTETFTHYFMKTNFIVISLLLILIIPPLLTLILLSFLFQKTLMN